MSETNWYVVYTYSGYESKVKVDIEKTIENRNLQGQILEASVPMQSVVETKNGVEKATGKKMFPGYALFYMIMNDNTWYAMRSTRGVTDFVGPDSKPIPLTEEEMISLGFGAVGIVTGSEVDDAVIVTLGAWKDTVSAIKSIDESKKVATIDVETSGRETPVELASTEVKKM